MDDAQCGEGMRHGFAARRVRMPSSGVESWTVVAPDGRAVEVIDEFLGWLTGIRALAEHGRGVCAGSGVVLVVPRPAWAGVGPGVGGGVGRVRGVGAAAGGERAGALRAGGEAVGVDGEPDARGGGFVLRVPGRRGNELARDLVVRTRSGRGGFKPFLHGIARDRPRGRAVRLPERQRLPRTLSLEQVAAVIDCQQRLRDRFLFALLATTGMRVGQALGLRHEDVVSWERRIEIVPREGGSSRARSKGGARGSVPVPGELIRLWSDYMHEEYRELDSDFVFVNLWEGEIGRPLSYSSVNESGAPHAGAGRVSFHRPSVAAHVRDVGVSRRCRA